jgi:hypothetical protein
MFNPKADHGTVQPAIAGAIYYQGGHYFNAAGRFVFSNPGLAPPPGVSKAVSMEEAERVFAEEETARGRPPITAHPAPPIPSSAPNQPGAVIATTGGQQAPQDPPPGGEQTGSAQLTREQQLMQQPYPKLAEMQLAVLKHKHPDKEETVLRKEIIKGPGSKNRIVAWLVENTEA